MRVRTLAELDAEVRGLTDTVNDPHISATLLTTWINQGVAELWRKLVKAYPDRYVLRATVTTTANDFAYDLEEDFLAIRRVDLVQGTQRIAIEPFALQEAPIYSADTRGGGRTRYRVVGGGIDGSETQIVFDPSPGANTYDVWYVQAPQLLVADDDVFDGIAGYEDFVVCFAALRVCTRQETDPSAVMAEMARVEASIVATAADRDVGRAPRIADVRRRGFARR